ncbi:EAL domain-containing protein [Streptomyces luteolus]|uniref:EAL domain-containing protein n=1 Tax=Streptomyces luteolus TaxID=3043615 RepID=A0ABT6T8I8_9ACTN|nr:EAL domain-containing protein [Streptomyces sp. B-S-A12]MDI3423162.1 EAL domain-containing protein [Streptomyces sp. B-S-A12]
MPVWSDSLRFAFQPVVNLSTGAIAALEILARPESGDVLAEARRDPELDGRLAAFAVRAAARQEALLPLHVNVFAGTVADLGGLAALRDAVTEAGRLPWEVTVDLGPPFTHVPQPALLEGVARLRDDGFRICADGVGDGDVPLRLLVDLAPELVKLDASLLDRTAGVRAMRALCEELGALLAVEGVETERQCAAALAAGAQLGQGQLFAPPMRRPAVDVYVPEVEAAPAPDTPQVGPSVRQFVRPAALLPATASAGQVRTLLTDAPDVSGVLLVNARGVPVRAVDRDRFLLSLSGRYGHALYADRPAARLADEPLTVGVDATAWEVLDLLADGERNRTGDDVAVVDGEGRCVGVVRLADLVRTLAESRVEEAAGLNPLTRLPGSDAVTAEVDRWIAHGRPFALSWLDVDDFKQVNDGAGFAAGDTLIREIGAALKAVAADTARAGLPVQVRVGHIGGDDFLLLAAPEALEPVAAAVLDASWSAGGREVTLSVATVDCPPGTVADHRQAAAWLAPLKQAAKALRGASWVVGRAGTEGYRVRRGGASARAGTAVVPQVRGRASA